MRTPAENEPGTETVIAAQRGDRKALDAVVAGYLPLLYNIVGRAMTGHADTDDVVQETLIRAIRGLPDLREPTAFRSWLVAIAIRQVRGYYATRAMAVPDTAVAQEPAPESDFADLTILQLGLSGQRRETAEATRWLDEDDRDLLALWWQETAGRLDRREVAEALGLPPRHAAVRIARMKEQLATARIVVRALHEVPPCPELAVVTATWDHHPSPLWRKRVARHARNCSQCGEWPEALVPAERLLTGLPLLPVPAALSGHLLAHGGPVARLLRPRLLRPRLYDAGCPRAGTPAALGRAHVRTLGKTAAYLQPKVVAASVALVTCAGGGAFAVVHAHAATTAALTVASPSATARPPPRSRPPPAPGSRAQDGGAAHPHAIAAARDHRLADPGGSGVQRQEGRRDVVVQCVGGVAGRLRGLLVLQLGVQPGRCGQPARGGLRPDDLGRVQRDQRHPGPGQKRGQHPARVQRAGPGQPVQHDGAAGAGPVAPAGNDRDDAGQPGRGRERRHAGQLAGSVHERSGRPR